MQVETARARAYTIQRHCPLCGANEFARLTEYTANQFFTDSASESKKTDVVTVQCRECATVYMNPVYTAHGIEVLFSEAGFSYGAAAGRAEEQRDWLRERGCLDAGSCILDAGCGDGKFLSTLPRSCELVGVDIDAPTVERARSRFPGVRFICGNFESFSCPSTPDTITMFHVLEHLPNPLDVLRHLRASAGPVTRLVVEVPVLEGATSDDAVGFFSPQHLTHFSRATLEAMLEAGGWSVTERCVQPGYNGYRVLSKPSDAANSSTFKQSEKDVGLALAALATTFEAQARVAQTVERIKMGGQLYIWGGGMHLEMLFQRTALRSKLRSSSVSIVDGDRSKQGRSWRGHPILAPDALAGVDWESATLLISSYGSQTAIMKAAHNLGVPADRCIRLYDSPRTY